MPDIYRIGELAKLTGLTVRALHYYEETGLLSRAERGSNGYRQYSAADVARLQKISSLKFLGFSLEQIKQHLHNPKFSLATTIPMQIAKIKQSIVNQEILVERLKAMEYYAARKSPIPAEQLFAVISMTNNMRAYLNEEEWAAVKAQSKKLGNERIRAAEAEWPALIKKVQRLIADGIDPKDPKVAPLAKRWMELVKEFTGGHPGVENKVGNIYQQKGQQIVMGDPNGANMAECINYIQKALK